MGAIKDSIINRGPVSFFKDHLVDSAKQTKEIAKLTYDQLIYKNLLENGSQLLSDKNHAKLKLVPASAVHYVSNHSLFANDLLKVTFDEKAQKHLITRLSNTHHQPKVLKKIGKVALQGLKTTGLAGLTLLSLPASVPCEAVAFGYQFGKNLRKKPDLKRPLEVEVLELNLENRLRVTEIMNIWQKVAEEKRPKSGVESTLFSNSSYIAGRIKDYLRETNHDSSARIVVCKDSKFNIPQAVAVVENNVEENNIDTNSHTYKYIHDLVTNPINIRSDINKKERQRVTGAATAVIVMIGALCNQDSIDKISLSALPSAIPFYTRIGFTPVNPIFFDNYLVLSKENFPTSKQLKKAS